MQSDGEGDVGKGAAFLSATHVLCVLASDRGGLKGCRGLFPLRISFVLDLCHVLPGSYRQTSKVYVETL